MRRLNSDLSDRSTESWRTPYLEIVAVGTIQFFLSLLVICYGVFLMQFILKDLYSLKTSLWTAILFISSAKITNPWVKSYCKHLDNVRLKVHKRNIIVTVILLFNDLVLLSFYNTPTSVIVLYGIFGGIFSSIIVVHLNHLTSEAFKHHPQLFTFLDQLTKSLSLVTIPHLILFLTNLYGTSQSFLIIAGLILNIIPACLLIRKKPHEKTRLCRFQTVDKLSIEMTDLGPKQPIVNEPSSSSSEEDDDEDKEEEEEEEKENILVEGDSEKPSPISSATVQKYYQTVGVKILPNIPEESDAEEEDDDINEISSKRLSRISAILQEINENTHKDINLSVVNLFQPEEIGDSEETEVVREFNEPSEKRSRCFSVGSSVIYNLKLRQKKVGSFCHRHFVTSFRRTLGTACFYPAIVSSCITTTLSGVVFATAPYFMCVYKEDRRTFPKTVEEATFLLTVIGLSWIFFLAGYPVFSKLSACKTKTLFLVGLSVLGLSLYIVHKFSYDNFVLFSLTFGLGNGIISYAESIANEEFFGTTKWKTIYGALEISTGLIVILIYLIIYFSNVGIDVLLSYAYWFYIFDVCLWIVAYLTKKTFLYYKSRGHYSVK